MKTLGQLIKERRGAKGLLLRHVAAHLDIDQAILSKIECGVRKASKDNVSKLAEVLDLDKEELMIHFFSEKIAEEIGDQPNPGKILKNAEKRIKFFKGNSY